ncbi:MAG: prepilin peptidase, partial [Patescibacteria group bacterium]
MPMMVFLFALLGAIIGSFAGVVAERLNTGEKWVRGRSRCNSCARELDARDLIPVLSWISSLGRCRTCYARVPVLYVLVELTLALLFALSYLTLGIGWSLVVMCAALSVLMVVVLYDLRHTIVPFGAAMVLLVFSVVYALLVSTSMPALGMTFIIAGCIGLGFALLFFLSQGRAMGLGDAPVALALSLLVAPHALSGLLFSFWIGALVGIVILVSRPKGHRMGIEVPFVPFLAVGFLLAFFTTWNPLGLVIGY